MTQCKDHDKTSYQLRTEETKTGPSVKQEVVQNKRPNSKL